MNVPSRPPFSRPTAVSPLPCLIRFAASDLKTGRACSCIMRIYSPPSPLSVALSRPRTLDTLVWFPLSSIFVGPACPAFAPCSALFISVCMRPAIEDVSFLKVVGRDGRRKSIYHVSIASVSRPAVNDDFVLVLL